MRLVAGEENAHSSKEGGEMRFQPTELNRQHAVVSGSEELAKFQLWGGVEFLDIIRREDSIASVFTSIDKTLTSRIEILKFVNS